LDLIIKKNFIVGLKNWNWFLKMYIGTLFIMKLMPLKLNIIMILAKKLIVREVNWRLNMRNL
jgi:hypothetical protein